MPLLSWYFSKIEFINADISTDEINYENEFDIVFSNACMQWIPNHHVLLKKLMNQEKIKILNYVLE